LGRELGKNADGRWGQGLREVSIGSHGGPYPKEWTCLGSRRQKENKGDPFPHLCPSYGF
jgi:hypothetical protein